MNKPLLQYYEDDTFGYDIYDEQNGKYVVLRQRDDEDAKDFFARAGRKPKKNEYGRDLKLDIAINEDFNDSIQTLMNTGYAYDKIFLNETDEKKRKKVLSALENSDLVNKQLDDIVAKFSEMELMTHHETLLLRNKVNSKKIPRSKIIPAFYYFSKEDYCRPLLMESVATIMKVPLKDVFLESPKLQELLLEKVNTKRANTPNKILISGLIDEEGNKLKFSEKYDDAGFAGGLGEINLRPTQIPNNHYTSDKIIQDGEEFYFKVRGDKADENKLLLKSYWPGRGNKPYAAEKLICNEHWKSVPGEAGHSGLYIKGAGSLRAGYGNVYLSARALISMFIGYDGDKAFD